MLRGTCLCGQVRFEAERPSRAPAACHCTRCRKQSGHFWASVQVDDDTLTVTGQVRWYASSPGVKRGFCPTCGSFLFWKADVDPDTGVALGALDGPTGLTLNRHIAAAQKGDYYTVAQDPRAEDRDDG